MATNVPGTSSIELMKKLRYRSPSMAAVIREIPKYIRLLASLENSNNNYVLNVVFFFMSNTHMSNIKNREFESRWFEWIVEVTRVIISLTIHCSHSLRVAERHDRTVACIYTI